MHRVDVLSNIDNTDIEPRSVRIGGSVEGQFVWQQEDTQIIVNSQVGAEVTTNFTKQPTTNFVFVTDVPVGIANGSSYLLRITAVPDEEIDFAVGDYLIDFVTDNVFNTFTNIRPVVDGTARDPLDLTNSVSGTYTYNIRNFVDSDVLVLTNDRRDDDPPTPQVDTVRIDSATNVWDFTETPTVGGMSITRAADTGIQRITTNLPHHSYRLPVDTTRQYWVLIDTNTPVAENISIHLRGQNVLTIEKPGAPNLHLGEGDNLFLITLSTNEINGWNTNAASATPNTDGFEIRDNAGNRLESIHDENQFFTGRGEIKEVAHFRSPNGTQTGTINFNDDGAFEFSDGSGGVNQRGFSVEQIGVITAADPEPANTYRWHTGDNEFNFGGLNGWAHASPIVPNHPNLSLIHI